MPMILTGNLKTIYSVKKYTGSRIFKVHNNVRLSTERFMYETFK